jgi:hypothetical protein
MSVVDLEEVQAEAVSAGDPCCADSIRWVDEYRGNVSAVPMTLVLVARLAMLRKDTREAGRVRP